MTYIKHEDGRLEAQTPGTCHHCGIEMKYGHVAFSNRDGDNQAPLPGDVGVCAECATISVTGEDGVQREPTVGELAEMARFPKLWNAIEQAQSQCRNPRHDLR